MAVTLSGIIPPVLTPFDDNEQFAPHALEQILEFLIGHGVHGVFVVGSVSEFYALHPEEVKEIIRVTIRVVDGRVPVLAGTGAIATRDAIAMSHFAEDAGVDAVSILTPFFLKPSNDELFEHYAAIARAVQIPVLGYTNPDRTGGVDLSPGLMQRLAAEYENIAGIKDSSADLTNLMEFQRLCPPDFCVFTGRDTLIVDTVIQGGAGAVSGLANVAPDIVVRTYEYARDGQIEAAIAEQRKLLPLRAAYSLGTFPGVLKEMATLIGLPVGPSRRPVLALRSEVRNRLARILADTLGEESLVRTVR